MLGSSAFQSGILVALKSSLIFECRQHVTENL
uniref:Uncharacterized protein n=1 Tax=Heterorhabditis bacteriophora TaxID=37862 RepID=A0A1I7WI84_HETBA